MKTILIAALFFLSTGIPALAQKEKLVPSKIQIVLLIDVSASMQGLLNQAKGQVWRMTNHLMKYEKNGVRPTIELALGGISSGESEETGFFQLSQTFTADIDLLCDQLCRLEIYGGNEYFGYAIQYSLDNLKWSNNKEDLRIIFIAGNEPFDQGPVSYITACKNAEKKDVIVNSIFCGNKETGRSTFWEEPTLLTKGKYMAINIDSTFKYGETFWDKKIGELNFSLNKTYIPYGENGEAGLQRQLRLDSNTVALGGMVLRERVVFKISDDYLNPHWDLVDACRSDTSFLSQLPVEWIPESLKGTSGAQRQYFIQRKMSERDILKETIAIYCDKAKDALQANLEHYGKEASLDNTIIAIIQEQAAQKGFVLKQ